MVENPRATRLVAHATNAISSDRPIQRDEERMKAFALNSADRPAELMEVPDPAADDDGIVVRVRAASVNGLDLFQASGRFASMVPHDFPAVVGRDFAGVADAVGSQWTDVEVGDEVLGFVPSLPPLKAGTFAELVGGPSLIIA